MKIFQQQIQLERKTRGFHLITNEIMNALKIGIDEKINKGVCQIFIQHTSASLTINENVDPTVRKDFETWFNDAVPENFNFQHDDEGPDDMPAHIKSSLLGSSVLIPVTNGKLALGTWQGIYLCEHRDHAEKRNLIITIWGE